MMPIMQEILDNGGEVRFTVTGNSMFPMLRHGKDIVVLKKAPRRLKRYDIPLFQRDNGKFILHRIIRVHRNSYTICGDNQTHLEHGINDNMIIGVVTGFVKDGTYTPCEDQGYRRYVKWRCRSRLFRHYGTKLKQIWSKLYGN